MSRKARRKLLKRRERPGRPSRKTRMLTATLLGTMFIAVTTMLALKAGVRSKPPKPQAVNGLDSSSPTKEMVFAGSRALASEEAATAISFGDVPATNPYYADIINIAGRSVTLGCGGGQYCTTANVTREQMAAFIMRSLGEFSPPAPQSQRFKDVPPGNQFYNFIDRMYVLGITYGCAQIGSDLYYCPGDFVTHGQMAAFMERALKNPDPASPAQPSFCDVPTNNQFFNLIEDYANLRRIWAGCNRTNDSNPACNGSPGCFCPECPVRRDEMAHILVRAFDFY